MKFNKKDVIIAILIALPLILYAALAWKAPSTVGVIGGADGPTQIYLSSGLDKMVGPVVVIAVLFGAYWVLNRIKLQKDNKK